MYSVMMSLEMATDPAAGDNTTMAADLRAKLLSLYKDNREYITFLTRSKLVDLERGDIVDITTSELGLSAQTGEVVNLEYVFPVPNQGRGLQVLVTVLTF